MLEVCDDNKDKIVTQVIIRSSYTASAGGKLDMLSIA